MALERGFAGGGEVDPAARLVDADQVGHDPLAVGQLPRCGAVGVAQGEMPPAAGFVGPEE